MVNMASGMDRGRLHLHETTTSRNMAAIPRFTAYIFDIEHPCYGQLIFQNKVSADHIAGSS